MTLPPGWEIFHPQFRRIDEEWYVRLASAMTREAQLLNLLGDLRSALESISPADLPEGSRLMRQKTLDKARNKLAELGIKVTNNKILPCDDPDFELDEKK